MYYFYVDMVHSNRDQNNNNHFRYHKNCHCIHSCSRASHLYTGKISKVLHSRLGPKSIIWNYLSIKIAIMITSYTFIELFTNTFDHHITRIAFTGVTTMTINAVRLWSMCLTNICDGFSKIIFGSIKKSIKNRFSVRYNLYCISTHLIPPISVGDLGLHIRLYWNKLYPSYSDFQLSWLSIQLYYGMLFASVLKFVFKIFSANFTIIVQRLKIDQSLSRKRSWMETSITLA